MHKVVSNLSCGIYVINLDRSPKRLEEISEQLARAGCHFIVSLL